MNSPPEHKRCLPLGQLHALDPLSSICELFHQALEAFVMGRTTAAADADLNRADRASSTMEACVTRMDTLIYRSKFGAFSDSIAERGDGGIGVGTAWLFRSG